MKALILVTIWVLLEVLSCQVSAYRRVCYYTSSAVYRRDRAHFEPEYIDPTLCTHLIYTFLGVSTLGDIEVIEPYTDIGFNSHEGQIQRTNKLKQRNPNLKTMIGVGGPSVSSSTFSSLANDTVTRERFANSSADFLLKYQYDGLDISWEYPGVGDYTSPNDKANLIELLKVFRTRFDRDGLLLSMATSATISSVDVSYDLPGLSRYLDFVNVKAYDLHGSWEPYTGHTSPINYGDYLNAFPTADKTLYVVAIVENFLAKGSDPQKLNLGIVGYGRSFTLYDANIIGMGVATIGPGEVGSLYSGAGTLGYNEICYEQTLDRWVEHSDVQQGVVYATSGGQWVGYDEKTSISAKADLVKKYNLGGVMFWSIDSDDFTGACTGTEFPLLHQIQSVLP